MPGPAALRALVSRPTPSARRAGRAWGVVAALAVALALGYALAQFVPGAGAQAARAAVADWGVSALALVCGAGALHAALVLRGAPAARVWALFGASQLMSTAGEVVWRTQGQPSVGAADVFYLGAYPLMAAGLLCYPTRRRGSRAAFALDALITGLSGAVVLWYFVIGPTAAAGLVDPGTTRVQLAVNLAYPLGDLLLLVGLAAVLLRAPAAAERRSLWGVVAGVTAMLGGDVIYLYKSLVGTFVPGGASDAAFVVTYAVLLASAALRLRQAERADARPGAGADDAGTDTAPADAEPAAPRGADARGYSLLPYGATAAAYGVLLLATRPLWAGGGRASAFGAGAVVFGTVFLTVAVVARQLVAMRENGQVQRSLAREQAAREGEARFRALVQRSADVTFILGPDVGVRYVSPAVAREFGHAAEALAGARLTEHVHPEDLGAVLAAFTALLGEPQGVATLRHRLRHADGGWRHVEGVASNLLDDPAVGGVVLNVRDVTERHGLEAQLAHQAFHDALTGLPNRARFRDRVAHALERGARAGAAPVAVLFLDLDDFKTVNDSLGHQAGDELLVQVAHRLRHATRGCDTVARLGGDEFAVLVEEADCAEDAVVVAERIGRALASPFTVGGRPARVGSSIGLARPAAGDGEPELLRNADVAMYCAKRAGKGGHVVFEAAMHAQVVERVALEAALREALADGRDPADAGLWVAFQPIVDLRDGRPVGAEALVRWARPGGAALAPADFIPLAEDTGLVVPLGRWVLAEACRHAAGWPAAPSGRPLRVSVNLSGRQLESAGLLADVAAALDASGLDPRRLTLEVTESTLMRDTERVAGVLDALRALGALVALDDFGTGYSSLSYLHRMPVDVLKIDKSFVDRIDGGGSEAALARSILMLGDALGLQGVAEGVETAAQRDALAGLGCALAQGYLFARPLDAAAFRAFAAAPHDADVPAGGAA